MGKINEDKRAIDAQICQPTEPPTTEPPTPEPTTTEPITEPPVRPDNCIDQVIYHKSEELMTYSEAITYCIELGMEMAHTDSINKDQNPCGWQFDIAGDVKKNDPRQHAWVLHGWSYYDKLGCYILGYYKTHSSIIATSSCFSERKVICMKEKDDN